MFVTNVYNHTACEGTRQLCLLEALRGRLEKTTEQKCAHVVGGDWNAGMFPEQRRGYTVQETATQAADARFAEFVRRKTLKGGWWAGNVTEGLLTHRFSSPLTSSSVSEIIPFSSLTSDPLPLLVSNPLLLTRFAHSAASSSHFFRSTLFTLLDFFALRGCWIS